MPMKPAGTSTALALLLLAPLAAQSKRADDWERQFHEAETESVQLFLVSMAARTAAVNLGDANTKLTFALRSEFVVVRTRAVQLLANLPDAEAASTGLSEAARRYPNG